MLEEVINRPDDSPAEVAKVLDSFFRKEFRYGGTGSESQFVRFFPIFLERVFGPVLANSLCRNHEFTKEQLDQIESAWLMQSRNWNMRRPTGSGSTFSTAPLTAHGPASAKLEDDPVVQLLSAPKPFLYGQDRSMVDDNSPKDPPSLIRILNQDPVLELSIIPNARVAFPFVELPSSMQRALIQLAYSTTLSSVSTPLVHKFTSSAGNIANGTKLLNCLTWNPMQQKDFMQNLRQVISLHYRSVGDMGVDQGRKDQAVASPRSPILAHTSQQQQQQLSSFRFNPSFSGGGKMIQDVMVKEEGLNIQLSLWEKYFMVFVRFPLLMGQMSQISQTSKTFSYGEKVYLHLLRDYIQYYFPHNFTELDESLYREKTIDREKGELLIRFMMEFWLERHIYTSTKDAIAVVSSQEGDSGADVTGLEWSYNLAELLMVQDKWGSSSPGTTVNLTRQKYDAPPKHAQRCIKILVEHLIADPTIARRCRGGLSGEKVKDNLGGHGIWPIPRIQTIVQPSLYNYVRTGLRYGPIHVTNSSFYAALDLWLLWIEPWNTVQRKKFGATAQAKDIFQNVSSRVSHIGGPTSPTKRHTTEMQSYPTVPKSNQPSKYTSAWESYVAANLHFYLVPFAIFLRRARELEFSRSDFHKSMNQLQRVLRVYSPQLVHTINSLLDNQRENEQLKKIVESHEANLGDYCPARPTENSVGKVWKLDMLREEMHNLLEEIVLQHRKMIGEQGFFERIFTRIEGLFGEGYKADENVILKAIESANLIVRFPQNYEVIPSGKRKDSIFSRGFSNLTVSDNAQDFSSYSPDREATGFLSNKGRRQLIKGARLCSASNVNFIGDPMYARPKTYEIKILVKWTLFVSNKLNVYFGLDTPKKCLLYGEEAKLTADQLAKDREEMNKVGLFRFNLRWLADTRNWILIYLVWKVVCKVLLR